MRQALLDSLITCAVLFTAGCSTGGADALVVDRAAPGGGDDGVVDGRLEGAIGPAVAIDGDATATSLFDDGTYLTVETIVARPGQAVMTLLSVSNARDLFVAGTSASFSFEGFDDVTLLGCVGDDDAVYNQYDKPADEIDVEIVDAASGAPGALDVAILGRWYGRDAYGETTAAHQDALTVFTLQR